MSSKIAVEPKLRWSLAARLTAWFAGSAFIVTAATTAVLYLALASTLEREDDQFLADKALILLATARDKGDDLKELQAELERESSPQKVGTLYLRMIDASGRTIAQTPGMSKELPPEQFPPPISVEDEPRAVQQEAREGRAYRALALRDATGRIAQAAMDRTAEEELLFSYRCYAAAALAAALLVCTAVGYALARRGLRPLRDVARMASRIGSSTLGERLDRTSLPAELDELAVTFNAMLDRLEDSFRRLERFSADIAHELRTPVNNLRGEAEVALGRPRSPEQYREVLASSLEELGRLAGLIDSLLFLARAESPQAQIARQWLDIGQQLGTVREFYEATAADAGIQLDVGVKGEVSAELDRTLFQRAIANLVANAVAHTPRGGRVTLSASREGNMVRIEVADTGCGIAKEHLPHVFDRFYRADAVRNSSGGSVGLGLALVKSIATLHGGRCTIDSAIGLGTRVTLLLPVERKT